MGVTIYKNTIINELLSDGDQTKLVGVKLRLLDFVKDEPEDSKNGSEA